MAATTYRQAVREVALDNYGYVTTRMAAEAGVPAVELPKLAARGGLEHVAYGLYRLPDVPPHEHDQFAEAILRAGNGAYLHGESVLALHGLADVNPRAVRVAVPRRARPRLPSFMTLVRGNPDDRVTVYDGLPAQRVADALLACRRRVQPEKLRDGAKQARKAGLLTTTEWERVRKGLM